MCQLAVREAAAGGEQVEADLRRIAQLPTPAPLPTPQQLANLVFTTVYLGTENSSAGE